MTGAEIVLNWIIKYYQEWGTPNFGEIQAQLEMAIEEEKRENKSDTIDLVSVSFPSDELIEERGEEFESKTYHNLKQGEKIGDFAIGAKWVVDYLQGNER